MAKAIKDLKGRFDYTGVLTSLEVTKTKNDKEKLDFTLTDKEVGAVVSLQIWKNDTASYWHFKNRTNVTVTGDIERQMNEVRATNIGMVHSIKITTPKGTTNHYISANAIADLMTLKPNSYVLRVTGELSFREYNGKATKNHNVETIEVFLPQQKVKQALRVNFPMVIGNTQKPNLVSKPYATTLTSLVKCRLPQGGYGYRPLQLTLDNNMFLDGNLAKISATNGMPMETIMNEKILPIITKPLNDIDGYGVMYMDGRLKVGEVTRKPTLDDLNPMERISLELQGEEAVEKALSSMKTISKYSDTTYIVTIGLGGGQLVEPISESELNLAVERDDSSPFGGNTMMDIANSLMGGSVATEVAPTPTQTQQAPTQEVVAEVKEEEATIDDLCAFLEEEDDTTPQAPTQEVSDDFDSSFPF